MSISGEQMAVMVEFMERHGDIANIVNTPQGRVKRQQLWQELKELLGQIGHGPDKTLDQWIKTWSDLKHRTKKKVITLHKEVTGTGGGPSRRIRLSDFEQRVYSIIGSRNIFGGPVPESVVVPQINEMSPETLGGGINDSIQEPTSDPLRLSNTGVDVSHILPTTTAAESFQRNSQGIQEPTSNPLRLSNTGVDVSHILPTTTAAESFQQNSQGTRPNSRRQRRHASNLTPFDRAATSFAEIELKRLKFEEERDRRQFELEQKRLELETLREVNLQEREASRAQIDMDAINVQQGILNLLKDLKSDLIKFLNK